MATLAFSCMALIMLSKLLNIIFASVKLGADDSLDSAQKSVLSIVFFIVALVALTVYAIPFYYLFTLL